MKALMCVLIVALLGGVAQADKLTANIRKDGDHWVLDGQGKDANAAKVVQQIARARAQLEGIRTELLGKQYDAARLSKLEKTAGALEDQVRILTGRMYDKAEAKDLAKLSDGLVKARRTIRVYQAAQDDRLREIEARVAVLEKRRSISLDLQGFGGGAIGFEYTGGAAVGLFFPLGMDMWGAKLTGGLGVGPSDGLAILASLSISARLGMFSIGPAAIYLADFGNLAGGTRGFVLGGGFEASVFVTDRVFISVLPFVGVSVERTYVLAAGPASYRESPVLCGAVGASEQVGRVEDGLHAIFSAGAVGSIGFRFF